MVRVRSLGDNLALLTPREGENMEELVQLNKEWFDSVFLSIVPWSAAQVVNHRVVWVRCFGLPISLWNRECFAKVIGESNSLIAIDDTTLLWENLEFARLKVRVENNCFVRVAKKMRINNQVLSISIEEECPMASIGICKGYHCSFESSDSITSIESYVEESALSVKSGEEECNRKSGEERQSTGEAVGGGEEDGRDDQKSKAYSEVHSARSRECQKGGDFSFTNEVIQSQNPLLEPAFDNYYGQICGYPLNRICEHDELARIVVDIEYLNTQNTIKGGLGQVRNLEAHLEEVQTGVGASGSGSGPSQTEIGSDHAHRFARGAIGGSLGGKGMHQSQEERSSAHSNKEISVSRTIALESGAETKTVDQEEMLKGYHQHEETAEAKDLGDVCTDSGFPIRLGIEEGGRPVGNAQRQRKTKGLMELAAPNSHPRRSVRLRSKAARVGNLHQTIRGMPAVSLSDGDIDNCNSRLRDMVSPADPSKLWAISRRVGIFCRGMIRRSKKNMCVWKLETWSS